MVKDLEVDPGYIQNGNNKEEVYIVDCGEERILMTANTQRKVLGRQLLMEKQYLQGESLIFWF